MVNKIKIRFILITYLALFIVVGGLIGYINYSNYQQTIERHQTAIDYILNTDTVDEYSASDIILGRNIIVVAVKDSSYIIIQQGELAMNTEIDIDGLVNYVMNQDKTGDTYSNYLFGVQVYDEITTIAFSCLDREFESTNDFFTNSILISIFGLLCTYILIYFLSFLVVKPFVRNEELQKQFITDASHELKTPITVIKANLDVLKLEEIDNEWTKSIKYQCDRLDSLTRNLVELSRVEEIVKKDKYTDFSLSDAILEECNNLKTMLLDKKIQISDSILPMISYTGDEVQIRNIIKILIENASKYTTGDIINVELNTKYLIVSNETNLENGSYEEVFKRFVRLDQSRNHKIEGYGIGLSIVKKIMDNHDGEVTANVINGLFIVQIKY